ncbi:MAG: VOC family protein [Myxococcota bacterium]
MPHTPPAGQPQIAPSLVYDDPRAAIAWLQEAFGFEVRMMIEDGDGNLVHNELEFGAGLLYVAGPGFRPGAASPGEVGGKFTTSLYVYVDDVDVHCERARAAGAKVVEEPVSREYGERVYGCEDCGGHLWYFGQRFDQDAWDSATEEHGAS